MKQLVQIIACYLLEVKGDGFWAFVEAWVCRRAVLSRIFGKHFQH